MWSFIMIGAALVCVGWWAWRLVRVVRLGQVSEDTRGRYLPGLALALVLSGVPFVAGVSFASCAAATPPVVTEPAPTPQAARLEVARKTLVAVRKVGLVVEQIQQAEIALYRGGLVPQLTEFVHAKIQTTFQKTAASVIAATDTLAHAVETTDPAIVVQAIRDGLKELNTALDALSDARTKQLAGWIDTAAALIEIALL